MKAHEHYDEAMRLLAQVGNQEPTGQSLYPEISVRLQKAQIHAMLAQTVAIGDMLTDFSEHLADHHRDEE